MEKYQNQYPIKKPKIYSSRSSNKPQKDVLDSFYTKKDIIIPLLSELDLTKFEEIIEPSAGDGAFSDELVNCIALDINPKKDYIQKCDFLSYSYDGSASRDKILVLGNPPFGKLGSQATKFIKKASTISDTIAFILPISFRKTSFKKRIPKNYHLTKEKILPENSFVFKGEDFSVPTVFQIWENLGFPREKIKKINPPDWILYVKRENSNLCVRRVGVYAGRAYGGVKDKSEQSHYFLKVDEDKVDEVIDLINSFEWEHNNTVGPRSISKNEFNKKLNSHYFHLF